MTIIQHPAHNSTCSLVATISTDWLGVMLAEDGVVSTVTVWSVSSPGLMEVRETSGGDNMWVSDTWTIQYNSVTTIQHDITIQEYYIIQQYNST